MEGLVRGKRVVVVPGDHFGIAKHLKIRFGLPHDYRIRALDRVHDLVAEVG